MHLVYLLAGGNIDNTISKYQQLFLYIKERIGTIVSTSHYYASPAWGYSSEHEFVNIAVIIDTLLSPEETLRQCLTIEKLLGRKPHTPHHYADRTMDIDIIFYDEIAMDTPRLQIPHPKMHLRNFVLTPLAEICPQKTHPILNRTIIELKKLCPDKAIVKQVDLT